MHFVQYLYIHVYIYIHLYICANNMERFISYPYALTQPFLFLTLPTPMSSFPPPFERYGLLLSGALLAALPTDVDRQKIMDYTYETFLGWRRMCELSKDLGFFRMPGTCVCRDWWE